MFLPDLWDDDEFKERCRSKYQTEPQFDWALDFFGGRNPKKDFNRCSNIVFFNGELDPWKTGG